MAQIRHKNPWLLLVTVPSVIKRGLLENPAFIAEFPIKT
jgi:hypothetical protein